MLSKAWKVVFILTISALTLAAGDDDVARNLVAMSREAVNLTAKGAKPFRMRLSFHAYNLKSGELDGTYELFWKSDEQLRKEVQLGTYQETEVRVGSSTWRKSNLPFSPLSINMVEGLFRTLQNVGQGDSMKFGKIREEMIGGLKAQCVEAREHRYTDKYCLGPDHSILRIEYRSEFDHGVHEYSDYSLFGPKLYPRKISYERGGKKYLEAKVESLEEWTPTDETFQPPVGAELTRICEVGRPTAPKAVYAPDPEFPVTNLHANARVVLHVRISPEGKLTAAEVQETAGPEFDREAIRAVRQWRFEPAKCAGEPVEVEVNIEVNFHAGR